MLGFLTRDEPGIAAVYFPGSAPPAEGAFGRLAQQGIRMTPLRPGENVIWSTRLDHDDWGTAELACVRAGLPDLDEYVQHATNLTTTEKEACRGARSVVTLRVDAKRKHVLSDRKRLLRFARAVLGADGVIVVDFASQLPWSPASLDDELHHDADLDVEALYVLHAVHDDDNRVEWLHTHGLGELGAFDVDVVRPSAAFVDRCADPFRSLAFRILSGDLSPSTPRFSFASGGIDARLIPAGGFMETAGDLDRLVRLPSADEHRERRAVLCEPAPSGLGRLMGRRDVEAFRFAQGEIPEQLAMPFPDAATELMAERARRTLPLLPPLMHEFADFNVVALVKLGWPTDDDSGREHLWFQAHGFEGDNVDATLENRPYAVSSLRQGDRGRHSLALLTDWVLITPVGWITPRSLAVARRLRELPSDVRAALRAQALQ
jgi:uncharacterized protein DUF2314